MRDCLSMHTRRSFSAWALKLIISVLHLHQPTCVFLPFISACLLFQKEPSVCITVISGCVHSMTQQNFTFTHLMFSLCLAPRWRVGEELLLLALRLQVSRSTLHCCTSKERMQIRKIKEETSETRAARCWVLPGTFKVGRERLRFWELSCWMCKCVFRGSVGVLEEGVIPLFLPSSLGIPMVSHTHPEVLMVIFCPTTTRQWNGHQCNAAFGLISSKLTEVAIV